MASSHENSPPSRSVALRLYPGSEPRTNASPRPHARDLHCLFDESDTHGPTPNVVMAGFIGTPSQWERFDKRLAKLQGRHGFSIVHSTELKSRRGDFAGWTDDQARALINDLVALV